MITKVLMELFREANGLPWALLRVSCLGAFGISVEISELRGVAFGLT